MATKLRPQQATPEERAYIAEVLPHLAEAIATLAAIEVDRLPQSLEYSLGYWQGSAKTSLIVLRNRLERALDSSNPLTRQ